MAIEVRIIKNHHFKHPLFQIPDDIDSITTKQSHM